MLKIYNLLFIILFVTGCGVTQEVANVEDTTVVFTTIAEGSMSGMTRAQQFIIGNKKDWDVFWRVHNEGNRVKDPAINFEQEMVLAVYSGQRPSGGYSIKIEKLKMVENVLVAYFSYHEPGPRENVSLAVTQPFHIIRTRRHNGKIQFVFVNHE